MLTWLGLISYSLYLMHVPIGAKIIDLGARFTDGGIGAILVLAAATGGSIVAAWVLYRSVELPSRRLSARISYRANASVTQEIQSLVARQAQSLPAIASMDTRSSDLFFQCRGSERN